MEKNGENWTGPEGGDSMDGFQRYVRLVLNIVIPVAEILLICLLGPRLLVFFMPFVVGWLIAMIANPLVRFLERRGRIVRRHSSAVIVVVVLALVIWLGYLVISRLAFLAMETARNLPAIYESMAAEMNQMLQSLDQRLGFLPDTVQEFWKEFTGDIGQNASLLVQQIASPTVSIAGSMAKSVPSILVNTVVMILSSYFFIAEQEKILALARRYLPRNGSRYLEHLKKEVRQLLVGYFLAQFRIMVIVAVLLFAGFLILGIPYAILVAILVAFLDFLPVFGTGTVLIPWALCEVWIGKYALAAGLVLLYVLTQVVRQIIQPKIVGDTMGLSPLSTLLLLFLGFKLRGISGMILAVPVGIFVRDLYRFGVFDSMIESARELVSEIQRFRKGEDIE
ncbi:MAG: sporulation integral membrane protein YtvI [Clostridiales bacterium]|nr:sporulation integral membrane protein YtvI [Clostridiales bacterium]